MAAKYLRRQTWWIRFYHPLTGKLVRDSLETHDEAQAELLRVTIELFCRRIEVERTLSQPRFQTAEMPAALHSLLVPRSAVETLPLVLLPPPSLPSDVLVTPTSKPLPRTTLDHALAKYLTFIRNDNASHHVAGKLSMLRAFLGRARVNRIAGLPEAMGRSSRGPVTSPVTSSTRSMP